MTLFSQGAVTGPPELPLTLRVCDCGVVATDYAAARCGEDARRNIRSDCPTRLVRITAWEPFPADTTTPEEGATT